MSSSAPQPTVLVVEDVAPMRQLACGLLSCEGYEVLEAADGASALYIIYEHKPDLTLLDIHLPDMTGLELAALIEGYPFAILTMDLDPELFRKAEKLGALNYYIKPPKKTEFVRSVALSIKQGKARGNLQKAMQSNRNVAKTVGLLIGNLGFTEEYADRFLRDYASRHRRSLHKIADDMLGLAEECAGDTQRMAKAFSSYLKIRR